jgi:hypothetical protein
MKYKKWIERERSIRKTLLLQSSVVRRTNNFRVCLICKEVLLCHETNCPNCGSENVIIEKIDILTNKVDIMSRIRCKLRYNLLY